MSSVRPMLCSSPLTADSSAATLRLSALVLAPRSTPFADSAGAVVDVVVGGSTIGALLLSSRRRAKAAPMIARQTTTATAKPVREEKKSRSRPGALDDMAGGASTAATNRLRVPAGGRYFRSAEGGVLVLPNQPYAHSTGRLSEIGVLYSDRGSI